MTSDSVAQTVYTLFSLCYRKLESTEQTQLWSLLDIDPKKVTADTFYPIIDNIKITTVNTEAMAVKKAVKSKVLSWYKREYKKMHGTPTQTINYGTDFIDKTRSAAGSKLQKKVVPMNNPKTNADWNFGITSFCLRLVSVGLASFGTFAGYFFYYDGEYAGYYVVKLQADKESGGKKIVFVKN